MFPIRKRQGKKNPYLDVKISQLRDMEIHGIQFPVVPLQKRKAPEGEQKPKKGSRQRKETFLLIKREEAPEKDDYASWPLFLNRKGVGKMPLH